jgi:hypothetical protein
MEPGLHLVRLCHSHILRQNGVQCALQGIVRPLDGDDHSCCLAEGVNSGVGPSCAEDGDAGPAKALHRVFEHSLNRPLIGLTLPACEASSIILKNELQRSRFHC